MAYAALIVGVGGLVMSGIGAAKKRAAAKTAAKNAKIEQDKQNDLLKKEKAKYRSMKFTNPYKNMENVYEDLTVNKQEADFQTQQGNQQRANIMQSLKGAAGATGAAGLAQSLANQGSLQTQRISASIGKQESVNQLAAAKGAGAIQVAEKQGDQMVQQFNADRQSTLLGMQMGESAGANAAKIQADMNEMNAQIAQQTNTANMFGTVAGALASNPNVGGDNNNIFLKG